MTALAQRATNRERDGVELLVGVLGSQVLLHVIFLLTSCSSPMNAGSSTAAIGGHLAAAGVLAMALRLEERLIWAAHRARATVTRLVAMAACWIPAVLPVQRLRPAISRAPTQVTPRLAAVPFGQPRTRRGPPVASIA